MMITTMPSTKALVVLKIGREEFLKMTITVDINTKTINALAPDKKPGWERLNELFLKAL